MTYQDFIMYFFVVMAYVGIGFFVAVYMEHECKIPIKGMEVTIVLFWPAFFVYICLGYICLFVKYKILKRED